MRYEISLNLFLSYIVSGTIVVVVDAKSNAKILETNSACSSPLQDDYCVVGIEVRDGRYEEGESYLLVFVEEKGGNGMNDPVNHPSHYTDGKIEVLDFIEDKKLNYHRGNAVKYICRAGKKDPTKEAEDLEKAVFYLNREIQLLKGE